MKQPKKPPREIEIKWCPTCGRTDRYQPFTGKQHFHTGKPCPGKPVPVAYVPKAVA